MISREDIKLLPADVVIEKAKAAYNYCCWNKNTLAHRQSKGCESQKIAKLHPNTKLLDLIEHKDETITIITSNKFFIRFLNI